MTTIYDVGDKPKLVATFTDADTDEYINPDGVIFITTSPAGDDIGYHYGLSNQGAWDAKTNTPVLADGTGTVAHCYTVSVAGSVDLGHGSITFAVSDLVYYNGNVWQKLPNPSVTTPTPSAKGIYYIREYCWISGIWRWRCEGLGTGQAAAEDKFTVRKREVA